MDQNDGRVTVNDQVWRPIGDLAFDQAALHVHPRTSFNFPAAFPPPGVRTAFDYLEFMYPKDTFPAILAHTSAKLRSLHKPELTKGEYWRWLGIRVVMVLEPRKGALTVYWETVPRPFTVYLPANFAARFRMTRHRFQDISRCLSFAAPPVLIEGAAEEVTGGTAKEV